MAERGIKIKSERVEFISGLTFLLGIVLVIVGGTHIGTAQFLAEANSLTQLGIAEIIVGASIATVAFAVAKGNYVE